MPTNGVTAARAALVALIAALIGVIAWQRSRLSDAEARVRELSSVGQVSLPDGTVRAAEIQTAPGGADEFASHLGVDLSQIRNDAAALGASVNSLVASTVRTYGKTQAGLASSASEARPAASAAAPSEAPPGVDRWKYTESRQVLTLTEPAPGGEVPWGTVGFSAWQQAPWDIQVLPRSYKSYTVGAIGSDGKRHAYTQFEIEVDGRTYKLPVANAQYVEDEPPSSFRWRLTPMLGIGIGPFVHAAEGVAVLPGLQFALASYGQPGTFATWVFAVPGVAYEPRLGGLALTLVPAYFNIGKPLPLLENLYVGPDVAVQFGGGVSVGVSAGVGL